MLLLNHDLKPWRRWVVADLDDDYLGKIEDVLELYERWYGPEQPAVCLDEKPNPCAPSCASGAGHAGREALP